MKKNAAIVAFGLAVAGCLAFAGRIEAAQRGPRPGVWQINFDGPNGGQWVARLVLRAQGGFTYSGYADWEMTDGTNRRREFFTGVYDPRANTFTLVSKNRGGRRRTVTNAGAYVAAVSDDGARMYDGTWNYLDQPPGQWSAVWRR